MLIPKGLCPKTLLWAAEQIDVHVDESARIKNRYEDCDKEKFLKWLWMEVAYIGARDRMKVAAKLITEGKINE